MNTAHARTLSPGFLRFCVALAALGALALVVGNVWGSAVVPGHDWVADTVSDLAAGRFEIIQDIALYGYAAGLLALALAAAHYHAGEGWWTLGAVSLVVLAALVVVIGARNEYGDGDSDGVVIHIYLVYALGAFFTLAPLALAPGVAQDAPASAMALRVLAGVWAVGSVVFFAMPDGYDGAWERGLGLVTVAMVTVLALYFRRAARAIERG